MFKVGIIVNPFSGKDLRRITSQASNVANHEKAIKVVRMINSMIDFGVKKVYLMPDNYMLNASIASTIRREQDVDNLVEILNFKPSDQPEDTIVAIEMMKDLEIDCLIVLGGDGTSRLAAKTEIDVPLIAVSTGTNNVYPQFWEGTTVGIAASYIGLKKYKKDLEKSKRIEIFLNGEFEDIALVDAVITEIPYVGSKVISKVDNIKEIIATICLPWSIGFSSIVGSVGFSNEDDDYGYRIKISDKGSGVWAPISPGKVENISCSDFTRLDFGVEYVYQSSHDGTIALDGERTVCFRKGDQLKFVIRRNGPYKVDIQKILKDAVENKFFIQVNDK